MLAISSKGLWENLGVGIVVSGAPGEDEIKDAIETILKAGMAAAVTLVNTDRSASGIEAITSPATTAYVKTSLGYNIDRLGSPAVQITMDGEPVKIIEIGDREAWEYTVRVALRHVGLGETILVAKEKLDMYKDVLNRILGSKANNTLGGIAWECQVDGTSAVLDKQQPAGFAIAILKVFTND